MSVCSSDTGSTLAIMVLEIVVPGNGSGEPWNPWSNSVCVLILKFV